MTTIDAVHGTSVIETREQLRAVVGSPKERAAKKDRSRLEQVHRDWLAASPFCLIATSAPDGTCDASPKGDPPGFALALDDTTVVIPERPGNRRVDGYQNVLENPHVGLLFVVPGRTDTLRINGRATLVSDAPFFDRLVVKGHRPVLALVVHVEQLFFHCGKAFLRSELWDPDTWAPDALPSRARIAQQFERADQPLEEIERYYAESYREGLYRHLP
jgi:PPOX class probable FMN-dependent enzyme